MAFFDCVTGGGSETELWTNGSPTSAMAGNTDATLSQAYTNFDLVRVYFRLNTSDATTSFADFPKALITSASPSLGVGLLPVFGALSGGYGTIVRQVRGVSSTSIRFTNCNRVNTSGTANDHLIPTKICGVK